MAEDKKETPKEQSIELVSLSQETGVGIRMEDGNVMDLTGLGLGHAQVLAYLVKSISDIKKNVG